MVGLGKIDHLSRSRVCRPTRTVSCVMVTYVTYHYAFRSMESGVHS